MDFDADLGWDVDYGTRHLPRPKDEGTKTERRRAEEALRRQRREEFRFEAERNVGGGGPTQIFRTQHEVYADALLREMEGLQQAKISSERMKSDLLRFARDDDESQAILDAEYELAKAMTARSNAEEAFDAYEIPDYGPNDQSKPTPGDWGLHEELVSNYDAAVARERAAKHAFKAMVVKQRQAEKQLRRKW